MARTHRTHPSFFKVLIGDFNNQLRIPPAFVKKLGRVTFKNAVLKTDAGKSWTVNMNVEQRSLYFFEQGWKEFVKDQHLELGDFLVFTFLGHSRFRVMAFGPNACEKGGNAMRIARRAKARIGGSLEPKKKKANEAAGSNVAKTTSRAIVKIERSEGEKEANEAAGSGKRRPARFVKTLKKYNNYVMVVPIRFAVETGMRWKTSTKLRDPEGRSWEVKLCVRRSGRIEIGSGWSDFVKANRLSRGDTCSFSFHCNHSSDDAIRVEIIARASH